MNSREKLDYAHNQTLHKTTESILAAELSIQPTSKQKSDKKWQSLPIRISNYPPIQLRPYRNFFFSHPMLVPHRRSDKKMFKQGCIPRNDILSNLFASPPPLCQKGAIVLSICDSASLQIKLVESLAFDNMKFQKWYSLSSRNKVKLSSKIT